MWVLRLTLKTTAFPWWLLSNCFQESQRTPYFETPCCRGHKSTCPCLRGCPCGGSRRLDHCTPHLVDCGFPIFHFDICNETNKQQNEQNKSKLLPMWRLKALGSLHSSPSWLLTDQLSWLVLIFVCFIKNINVRNRKTITNPHYRCYRRAGTCSFWCLFVSLFHNKYKSGK